MSERYCEVTWGHAPSNKFLVPRCENPGECVAVSIGDQSRQVVVICAEHRLIAENLPMLWAVAALPHEAVIGTRKPTGGDECR